VAVTSFAHWLETRMWAEAFAGSVLLYPIVLATHLTCIAFFGGMILVTNLRLLGYGFAGRSAGDLIRKLRWWKRAGFVIMATCGALLAGSEAGRYSVNPYFWTKLTLLALLGVHGMAFRRSVYGNVEELDGAGIMPVRAKLAAALSLLLWTGVVCSGRMIGYYQNVGEYLVSVQSSVHSEIHAVFKSKYFSRACKDLSRP